MSAVQVLKILGGGGGKGEIARNKQFLIFSISAFYTYGELSVIYKLLSANSFSLEESKICRLGKG